MYDNIGGKIKKLAQATFLVEALAATIFGFYMLAEEDPIIGITIMLFGPIVAFVGSWLLYGYGELIDKSCEIERNTRGCIENEQAEKSND